MKPTVIHLWVFACVAYGFAIALALRGQVVGSTFSTVVYVVLLICTR
jgi:hypothetical protein